MTVVERPLSEVRGSHRATGDGVTMVAQGYRKGTRLDAPTHREAQLVYAARGTMQVTTPKGRWLVPPDRAVWVPARLPHAIDVLADIEMRTLYFDLAWLKRERCGTQLTSEFVVRVSALLQQAILALFDRGRYQRADRAPDQACDARVAPGRGLDNVHSAAKGGALPPRRGNRPARARQSP